MKWYENLYLGESVTEKKANRIKWKLNHNAGVLSYYVIAFPSNPDNLLDLIPTKELKQKGYPKKDICVIGLAKGYEEAVAVVQQIVSETYQNTKDVNIRKYLKEYRRKDE